MLENLYNYYHNNITREDLNNARTLLNDDDRLLYYTCYAYNCYELLHSKGHLSLILNPDALFRTPEAERQFVMEMKNYIRDVIGIEREDVQYEQCKGNQGQKETTEN